jgi:hypothetical protein
MDGYKLTTAIRRRLYRFAERVARPFSDSRRRTFVSEMLCGLVASGHIHLTAIARGCSGLKANVHAIEKRFSSHLSSKHWDMSPVADQLLACSASMVTPDTLLVADTTDLSKPYARHLEGLGRVHDGSDPRGRITPGYCVFEAFVRVGKWQLFPLVMEPLKTYGGARTAENIEFVDHLLRCHQAANKQGTWVLDRGFDRRELYRPLVRHEVAFVVRQRGDRHIRTIDGRTLTIDQLVAEQKCPKPRRWPDGGEAIDIEVWLPEVSDRPFLLVIGWKVPNSERPLVLLASPTARRPRRTARWYVRTYVRRWGTEDANRGIKQRFRVEGFLVRSWRSIRRLFWLVAWAFWWLNLWGEKQFDSLRQALMKHPWRLPKPVVYLFGWIALMLSKLLHPNPKITYDTG